MKNLNITVVCKHGPPDITNARLRAKIEFISVNRILCRKAFKHGYYNAGDVDKQFGEELVRRARRDFLFSYNTLNVDIYLALHNLWKWLKEINLIK